MAKKESSVKASFKSAETEDGNASQDHGDVKEAIDRVQEKLKAQEGQTPEQPSAPPNIPEESIGYQVPTELVAIPSLGKIYPKDSPLFNVTEIEIRQMTAADEDILASRSLLRTGKAIDALLKNCIIDKSIDPAQLISGDKNVVMIALRVGAYGEEYKIDIECPECEETAKEQMLDLTKLTMSTLDLDPIVQGENRFEFVAPSGTKYEFKFLYSFEEKEISDSMDEMKKVTRSPVDRLITTRHKYQIISIDGERDRQTISRYVDARMTARDSRALTNYISSVEPDVDMKMNFECPECGHRAEVDVPITAQFFWPE